MSSANVSAGPASCMKFNSSFLYFIGFFILLVLGYVWGKRNGKLESEGKSTTPKLPKMKAIGKVSKGSKGKSKK